MLAHAGTLAGQTGGVHDLRGHCPRADVITNVRPVDTFDASRADIMKKTCFALIVLVLFTLYTAFTLWHADQSLLEFGLQLMSSPDTAQVVIDLYVMAGLACVWMYRDARTRGQSMASLWPYFLLTALFVSAGPLLYVVVKGFSRSSPKPTAR